MAERKIQNQVTTRRQVAMHLEAASLRADVLTAEDYRATKVDVFPDIIAVSPVTYRNKGRFNFGYRTHECANLETPWIVENTFLGTKYAEFVLSGGQKIRVYKNLREYRTDFGNRKPLLSFRFRGNPRNRLVSVD